MLIRYKICFSICFHRRNGPEWHRLRQALQRPLNMPENIRQYIPGIDTIAHEFAGLISASVKTAKTSPDFLEDRVLCEWCILYMYDSNSSWFGDVRYAIGIAGKEFDY